MWWCVPRGMDTEEATEAPSHLSAMRLSAARRMSVVGCHRLPVVEASLHPPKMPRTRSSSLSTQISCHRASALVNSAHWAHAIFSAAKMRSVATARPLAQSACAITKRASLSLYCRAHIPSTKSASPAGCAANPTVLCACEMCAKTCACRHRGQSAKLRQGASSDALSESRGRPEGGS